MMAVMNVRLKGVYWGLLGILALALTLVACGGLAVARPGCVQVVHDVPGLIHSETSGLSCKQIKVLVQYAPSDPGVFTTVSSSDVPWKCQLFDVRRERVLLMCQHHQAHFTIVSEMGAPGPR
jgi:hypothetical protein